MQKKEKNPNSPLWLSPTQVRVIPLKEEFLDFSKTLAEKISQNSVRVDIDDRNESIGKRIREAEKDWVPYILVIGEKEMNSENLSVRDRKTGETHEVSFQAFLDEMKTQTARKPFSKLNLPEYLSQRPQIMV